MLASEARDGLKCRPRYLAPAHRFHTTAPLHIPAQAGGGRQRDREACLCNSRYAPGTSRSKYR